MENQRRCLLLKTRHRWKNSNLLFMLFYFWICTRSYWCFSVEYVHTQVPINPYGKAKKMAEDIILDFSKNTDMAVMILRYVCFFFWPSGMYVLSKNWKRNSYFFCFTVKSPIIVYVWWQKICRYFNVIGSDPDGRLGEAPRPELREHGRISGACFDAARGIMSGLKVPSLITHPSLFRARSSFLGQAFILSRWDSVIYSKK